jgi:hypothetical protein
VSPRRRLAREEGISLTVAVCSLALMIMLGAVALQQAVTSLGHTGEQAHVKRALQAADAAIDVATFRLARLDLSGTLNIDPLNPLAVVKQSCIISRGDVAGGIGVAPLDALAPVDPNGRKWCPETAPEPAGDDATYSYRVSQLARVGGGTCDMNGLLNLDREIVAVGRSGGVTRRVRARLGASIALLSGAAVQSGSSTQPLTMRDTARVLGDVHGNGNITGTGLNLIAGNAVAGPGKAVSGVVPAGAAGAACQPFTLPQVDQGTAPTANQNTSRVDGCVDSLTMLTLSCTVLFTTTGGVQYDPARRTLRVWGNGRARLTGSTYSFCSIRLENSAILQIPSTTPTTRIFLDDPDKCRTSSGALIPNAGQITMDGQSRILNCHSQAQPESLQLYAVGNPSIPTTQTLASGGLLTGALRGVLCGLNVPLAGEPMTLYAPRSTVELGGSTAIAGQVAGDVVKLSGLAAVQPVNALINLNQLGANPILPLYKPQDYVECTGRDFARLPAANPAQGC